MKLVIQRVSQASVFVENKVCGSIQKGLLVLLGIHKDDKPEDTLWYVNKLINLRIFNDLQGKMNLNVNDVKGQILVISQFTLYGNCLSGRRPDFIQAAPPNIAKPIYDKFVREVLECHGQVQTGEFGAEMQVSLVNEGPVTFILEKDV
ncbi:MAG: D-tyrosyl-tRNA(Tyr) deacylase [Parachlamydiaceae bacterium]|nr:D-tyrosyl-tRNA(Tyr) deacylase [Parachlamydiaceae bacterium]